MPEVKISTLQLNLLLVGLLAGVMLFHGVFPEFVQKENGLGWEWDSNIYTRMVKNLNSFIAERKINSYYFGRIFPVALVYAFLAAANISLTDSNILTAFVVLNVLLLFIAFFCWILLCEALQLSKGNRLLSFTGIFVNYAILKMPFYYPVLTDLLAFTIGMIMLYCFLKNYMVGLVVISIIGAFSFPTLFYCGMLLYIFPNKETGSASDIIAKPVWNRWLAILAMAGFIFIWLFVRLVKDKPYINPVEEGVFPFSVAFALGYIYLIIMQVAQPARYMEELMKSQTWRRAIVVGILFLIIRGITRYFASPEAPVLNYKGFLANVVLEAITNPLVFIIAHFMYFGPVLFLLLYYWKPFITEVNRYGIGLHLLVFIYLLVGIGSESRQFINAWPVFVLFLCVALEKYTFPGRFYIVMIAMALVVSRFWYRINREPFTGNLLDFPYQHYFMSQGPWLSDSMYYLQSGITITLCLLIYWLFFRKPLHQHV